MVTPTDKQRQLAARTARDFAHNVCMLIFYGARCFYTMPDGVEVEIRDLEYSDDRDGFIKYTTTEECAEKGYPGGGLSRYGSFSIRIVYPDILNRMRDVDNL
jgi:hypothetical protein